MFVRPSACGDVGWQLYTKSYELFKKYSSTTSQGRLTLWIACRIAQTYYQSGNFELAIRCVGCGGVVLTC